MSEKNELYRVIDEFINNATPEELKEFNNLLEKRGSLFNSNINIQGFASDMAKRINKDIGYTQENIKATARKLVIDLALQYNPNISEKELRAVLQQMVPCSSPYSQKIPRDLIFTMVQQFISFSDGTMAPEMAAGFPEGWQKKYWDAFPLAIKKSIMKYKKREISKKEFWQSIQITLNGSTK